MNKSKAIIFFGTEDFSAVVLEALVKSGWSIELIVTKPDTPKGRGQKLSTSAVKRIGLAHNITLLQPDNPADIQTQLLATGINQAVLVAYGKIIPTSIINLFSGGIINVHPSQLPKYRGPAPIEAAILNGDKHTAVSLMRLSPKMDAGPVYYQEVVGLSGHEDKIELSHRLAQVGAKSLISKLPEIISGELQAIPQDEGTATYTHLIAKGDGVIDWSKPAERLEREIRAYAGWPKSRTSIFDQDVIITEARVAKNAQDGQLVMPAANSWLEILELIGPSGRSMSGADFRRGYNKN